jgi:DNA-binding response OmpR family regulator
LTTKEFAVLEALMRASPATLSTEDLLEQAWDEHTDPFTKTVQVTIGRLRRKLGEPDVIETIPGWATASDNWCRLMPRFPRPQKGWP